MQHIDNPWFEAHLRKEPPHESLVARIDELRTRYTSLVSNTRRMMSMYENGYQGAMQSPPTGPMPLRDDTLWFNYGRNTIDTIHAKAIKNKVQPMALTSGGGYLARRKAKQKTKAHEAEFEKNDFDGIFAEMSLDGLVADHGAGCIKVIADIVEMCLRYEHVPIEEVWVDDDQGQHKAPREIFQVSPRDRYVVLAQFEQDDASYFGAVEERRIGILKAGKQFSGDTRTHSDATTIDVYEGWRLPSRKGAGDGRHRLCVDSVCLIDEEWDWPCFPLAFYIPRQRRRSFWGLSLMRDLASGQRALEHADGRLERNVKKMGGVHVVCDMETNVDQIDNDAGTIIRSPNPQALSTFNPDLFNPQAMQWRESLVRWMPESRGVSGLSTRSEIPAGLQQASGKALQVFDDVESERLLPEHRAKERLVVQVAKLNEYGWRDLSRAGSDYKLEYKFKGLLEPIKIQDIAIGEDEDPVVTIFPVSQLAKQPAARFEQITKMLEGGAISVEQFRRLWEIPDLEAENEIDSADCDAVDWAVEQCAFLGKPQTPDGFYRFDYAIERVRKHINIFRKYELPGDRLQLVIDFQQALRDKQNELAGAAPPPGAGPMPMQPELGPMGPPGGGPPLPPPPMGPPNPPPNGMPPPPPMGAPPMAA